MGSNIVYLAQEEAEKKGPSLECALSLSASGVVYDPGDPASQTEHIYPVVDRRRQRLRLGVHQIQRAPGCK